jgi:hypothetical protein
MDLIVQKWYLQALQHFYSIKEPAHCNNKLRIVYSYRNIKLTVQGQGQLGRHRLSRREEPLNTSKNMYTERSVAKKYYKNIMIQENSYARKSKLNNKKV